MTDTNPLLIWLARRRASPCWRCWRPGSWLRGRPIAGRARVPGEPLEPGEPPVSDAGRDHADERVHYTPEWFGRREQSIHMAHVASVEIDTNLFFSNVVIETSGGSEPVRCHGHRKRDAVEMKRLIDQFQSEYYGPTAAQTCLTPTTSRRAARRSRGSHRAFQTLVQSPLRAGHPAVHVRAARRRPSTSRR